MSLRNAAVSAVLALGLLSTTAAEAEIGIGADLVNRYVWRGADFGDGASIQPYISYASGPVEVRHLGFVLGGRLRCQRTRPLRNLFGDG